MVQFSWSDISSLASWFGEKFEDWDGLMVERSEGRVRVERKREKSVEKSEGRV